jgi:hypothetical protein
MDVLLPEPLPSGSIVSCLGRDALPDLSHEVPPGVVCMVKRPAIRHPSRTLELGKVFTIQVGLTAAGITRLVQVVLSGTSLTAGRPVLQTVWILTSSPKPFILSTMPGAESCTTPSIET